MGVLSVLFENGAETRREQLCRPPQPGKTAVLSLNVKMQQLAEQLLEKNGRPSALVAIDSRDGAISWPCFAPDL